MWGNSTPENNLPIENQLSVVTSVFLQQLLYKVDFTPVAVAITDTLLPFLAALSAPGVEN